MALILAVNPGGTQSGTLARVARELPDHELVGADSCAVAISALADHKPVLVLLPASPPMGEPALLEQLRTLVKGGVPTLRLPPPTSVNPKALAEQIRQSMPATQPAMASAQPAMGAAQPPTDPPVELPSEHLTTAAKVAISWIRARRASWTVMAAPPPAPPPVAAAIIQDESQLQRQPDDDLADTETEPRTTVAAWLPRVAALAGAVMLMWAGMSCWRR